MLAPALQRSNAGQSDTALADVALAIGGLMQSVLEISEIDINPLTVHGKGEGAAALAERFSGAASGLAASIAIIVIQRRKRRRTHGPN